MTLCNCCGDCCKVIATLKPLRHYKDVAKSYGPWVAYWDGGGDGLPDGWEPEDAERARTIHATASFVAAHWHRITKREAWDRLPPMGGYPGHFYYICDQWDEDTKLCKAGDDRPPICKDFPWYGQPVGDQRLNVALRRCAYWADVKPENRPPTITLIQIQRKEVA